MAGVEITLLEQRDHFDKLIGRVRILTDALECEDRRHQELIRRPARKQPKEDKSSD